jgi:trk system potassium uptake protein TrkH
VFRRTIPRETVIKAMVTAMLFSAIATVALTALLALEQSQEPHVESKGLFLDAAFEVISALGTVGLSTGWTGELSSVGRIIIVVLMFIGRLGPITVFAALSRTEQPELVEFSSEEPLIG